MRDIVATVCTGYLPTLVSPESMTASAPSRTALATSDASARVGREWLIIDSSIWVATITGLALSRQIWMARFCTIGTCSSGSSTPRSPRATMMPSKLSTMSSRRSTASGFSILAITGRRMPTESMTWCTSFTSSADRTNDSATKSTPIRSANSRSSASFSDIAGTLTDTPGSDRPLLLLTGPPSVTSQTTSVPFSISTATKPDVAVVDEQAIARAHVGGQVLVRRRDPVVGSLDVLDGDAHPLAGAPLDLALREPAEADLGPLQVGQDGDVAAGCLGCAAGPRGSGDRARNGRRG